MAEGLFLILIKKKKNKYKDLIDQKKDIPHKMNHDSHDEYFSGDHRTEPKYPIDPNSKKANQQVIQ